MLAMQLVLRMPFRSLWLGMVLLGFGLVELSDAYAQTSTAAMDFPEGFQPVPGGKPKTEEVNASLLVIIAYATFALGFVGYLVHLARAQTRLAKDMRELGARIEDAERRDSSAR